MIPPNCYPGGTKLTVGSHEIEIIKYISQGGFALVYTCYISPSYKGSNIACLKRVVVPSKWQLSLLRQEVDAMRRLRGNKHIVSYIDSHAARLNEESATQQYEVFLLMEYCENKGLIDFMNTRLAHKLTEPEILQIMYQTTIGVAMCHHLQPPLIHRDIKIENVLIDKYNTYKLADFGSSVGYIPPPKNPHDLHKLRDDIMQHTTPQYRAPEMIDLSKGFAVDDKSDVWALGVFLYKLCYYTTPFESPNQSLQDMEHAILHSSQTLKFKDQPGSMFSPRLKNIIKCCLREDPRRRPNATQLLQEIVSMMGLPLPNVIPHSVEHQIKEKQTKPTANASQPLIRKDVVKPDPFTPEKSDPFESIDKTKFLDKSTKRLSAVNPIARPVTGSELSTSLTYKYTNKSATSLKDFVQKQVELSEESMARNSRKSEDKSDTLDFLKSKQESNHTGGSIKLSLQKHLRKISTGGSSVHCVSANNTGNTLVYNKKRSSISSIKQLLTGGRKTSDNHNEYEYFKGDSKHSSDTKHSNDKRYSLRNEEKPERESRNSIASRMQTLLRESESTPNLRTAHGYGKFTDLDDLNSINQLNFSSDESINLPKAPHVKQLLPPKIPASLSSKKSLKNSTVINSIYSKSSKLHPISGKLTKVPIQQEILSKKPINSHESKKPPPKPKKPTYLKSSAKNLYQRRSSNSSEISIPDLDDLEKKFNERFPSYA